MIVQWIRTLSEFTPPDVVMSSSARVVIGVEGGPFQKGGNHVILLNPNAFVLKHALPLADYIS